MGAGLIVDGVDLEVFGVRLARGARGMVGQPTRSRVTSPASGRVGAVLIDDRPTLASRTLTIPVLVRAASPTALREQLDALVDWLGHGARTSLDGLLTLEAPGVRPGRMLRVAFDGLDQAADLPPFARSVSLTLSATAPDPRWLATLATSIDVVAADTPYPTPVGSAESAELAVLLFGPIPAGFVITLRDGEGYVAGQFDCSAINLAEGDGCQIFFEDGTVTRTVAGIQSDVLNLVSVPDWFAIGPDDARRTPGAAAAWPTIEISGLEGDAYGLVTYRVGDL